MYGTMDEKVIPVGVKEIKVKPLRKPTRRWKDKVIDVKMRVQNGTIQALMEICRRMKKVYL